MRLHRPLTAERAIRAGSIPDLPYICNKGGAGTVYGRQPFLPVGAPAVNSGVQLGRVHSLSGAAARCWEPSDRGEWVSSSFIGGFNFGLHVGHGHALQCVENPAPVEFPSRWERSLLDGPGVCPSGSGA